MRRLLIKLCLFLGKERCLWAARRLAWASRRVSTYAHLLLFNVHWRVPPIPEWQDQFTTLHLLWERLRQPYLAERGSLTLLGVEQDATVLELCCGDGFFTNYFYGSRARSITAIDIDPEVIAYAKTFNEATNITYLVSDIRDQLPAGPFDAVIWNASLHRFTDTEVGDILQALRHRLRSGGVVSGYTDADVKQENEFAAREDVLRLFTPHFANAKVFESLWPSVGASPVARARRLLYFFASDGVLPFDEDWPPVTLSRNIDAA